MISLNTGRTIYLFNQKVPKPMTTLNSGKMTYFTQKPMVGLNTGENNLPMSSKIAKEEPMINLN